MIALFLALAAAQADRLPPANPLPLAVDGEEAGAMRAVTALLAAIKQGSGPAVLAATRAEGAATMADDAGKVATMRWPDFAASLNSVTSAEERLGTPAIEIDGNVGMVWAPYTLFVNGRPHHCGYDHFDLVREAGSWKVLNVTWSQRTTGCAAP